MKGIVYILAAALLVAFTAPALATGKQFQKQQVKQFQKVQRIEQVYVPQQVIVKERIVQQQNVYDPYLSTLPSTSSFRIRQEQIVRSRQRQQQFFNSRGGNFSSFTLERSSSGGGGPLRNLLRGIF